MGPGNMHRQLYLSLLSKRSKEKPLLEHLKKTSGPEPRPTTYETSQGQKKGEQLIR